MMKKEFDLHELLEQKRTKKCQYSICFRFSFKNNQEWHEDGFFSILYYSSIVRLFYVMLFGYLIIRRKKNLSLN